MGQKRAALAKKTNPVRIKSLEDLVNLNTDVLNSVINETIDHKKASLIFTGSRTIISTMNLGL